MNYRKFSLPITLVLLNTGVMLVGGSGLEIWWKCKKLRSFFILRLTMSFLQKYTWHENLRNLQERSPTLHPRGWWKFVNLLWCQKTRVITLSCGIKVSAVCSFVLSQSTRVTTDRQNYDPQDRASIAASHGKNHQCPLPVSILNKGNANIEIFYGNVVHWFF